MRAIPASLQAKLDGGATTLCRCWRLDREDGVSVGFTDHDRDLGFDGVVFEAAAGLAPGAIEQSGGLSVDTQEVMGALQSAAITADDIEAGLLDRATVTLFLVDWADVSDRIVLARGTIGEIRREGAAFSAEIAGLAEKLNRPVGRAYLGKCAVRLGSARCGVDTGLPAFRGTAQVVQALDRRHLVVSGLAGFESGWFARGHVLWSTGANQGLTSDIKDHARSDTEAALDLWLPTPHEVAVGDQVEVIAGCDKMADTCRNKFNNIVNFRGFPHMPGDDWATGYPNSGGAHDGGSLFRS